MPGRVFLHGFRAWLLTIGCLALVGVIALCDYWTGPRVSFAILYLIPVACAAWWGGLSVGTLLALAGALAWHLLDTLEAPPAPAAVDVWNGLTRFGTFVITSSLLSRLRVAVLRERALARTDPLTGAANGRTFYETACMAVEQALRSGRPITLAYIDLDDFKSLNDRLGHAAGDEALRRVAGLVRANVRTGDTLARLGGDEFALLLPDAGAGEAAALLSRLHRLLCQEGGPRGWRFSVSVGAATFAIPPQDVDVMVHRADALMYGAKRAGKGRLEHRILENQPHSGEISGLERRAAMRLLCQQQVSVREGDDAPADEVGTIRDISSTGVGLHLERRLPPHALVAVEPLYACGAAALLARVVWSKAEAGGWLHGCILAAPLAGQELQFWAPGQVPIPDPTATTSEAVCPGRPQC